MRDDFPEHSRKFWADMQKFVEPVLELVKSPSGKRLCSIQVDARERISRKGENIAMLTERIMAFVDDLLQIQAMYLIEVNEIQDSKIVEKWLNELHDAYAEKIKLTPEVAMNVRVLKDFHDRRDEILMEHLAAASLALYFLGVPFIQPWEKVLQLADERGGFPSGACVTKYLGDVYRTARQQMIRDAEIAVGNDTKLQESQMATQLLILSYAPLALLEGLLDPTNEHLTPSAVHQLGWCYALLQLRLYIRNGFPIKYFIPTESLKNKWEQLGGSDPNKYGEMIAKIKPWLRTVFPHEDNMYQSVRLLPTPLDTLGMPTCVLGYEKGMCVLDTGQHLTPFSGNPIRGELLASYREKLENIKTDAVDDDLQSLSEQQFKDRFMKILPPGPGNRR